MYNLKHTRDKVKVTHKTHESLIFENSPAAKVGISGSPIHEY